MLILSNKCGQLGNRLFAFAHLIAASEANQVGAINLSFDEYASFFVGTHKNLLCEYPAKRRFLNSNRLRSFLFLINKALVKGLRLLRINKSFLHQIVVADLPEYAFSKGDYFDLSGPDFSEIAKSKRVCFLFGRFFRDYSNIEIYAESIRSYFEPINEIREDLDRLHASLKIESDLLVGVHIRRGDYQQFVDGKYFFSLDEYLKKMKEVKQALADKNVRFVVCSNEKIDPDFFSGMQVTLGPGHLVKDMYLLAKCDYIMGPPSTYTLWASFYGRKPLCQIRDTQTRIDMNQFVMLPPHVLYNFSFN